MTHAFDKDYWDRHWERGGGLIVGHLHGHDGRTLSLRDAVVRAIRRGQRPTR